MKPRFLAVLGALALSCGGDTPTVPSPTAADRCSSARASVLAFGGGRARLPREWDGVPFRFDVIESGHPDADAYLRDSLVVVGEMADRIEEQLGYPVIKGGQ